MLALTTSHTWKSALCITYSGKSKKREIPLITKPLHKHTFHITCMKGKIKKSQREKWKGSSSKTSNELKRKKHFYANKMTAASFHIFPSEKIKKFLFSCLMSSSKNIHAEKEENTFRLHVNKQRKIFFYFREAMQQSFFTVAERKSKLVCDGKREQK
jgi:hypothetical protein